MRWFSTVVHSSTTPTPSALNWPPSQSISLTKTIRFTPKREAWTAAAQADSLPPTMSRSVSRVGRKTPGFAASKSGDCRAEDAEHPEIMGALAGFAERCVWALPSGAPSRQAGGMNRFLPLVLFALAVLPAHADKIVLVAGGGTTQKDAPATQCALHEPFCTEFTPSGEMVIAEMEHGNRILKVGKDGILHVIAGTGAKGYSGDGGPAAAATFGGIHNLIVRRNGDILLADSFNNLLRRIDAKTMMITTMAGDVKKASPVTAAPRRTPNFPRSSRSP